jgi:flavin-dependent thymidylate synthase
MDEMRVVLAGYNIDAEIIKELKERSEWTDDNVTPETLSAAYARISRDPANIGEIRKKSRKETDKARKSNETIIFGLGHSSVAEHAVFNFDVVGISRLAVEEIQKYRLASFTEKSQRYITLDGDCFIPCEILNTPFEKEFRELVDFQNAAYFKLYDVLKNHFFEKFPARVSTKSGKTVVDGWAKEDARYVVSLATYSQFGMTVNARTLEHMLRRFKSSKLAEIRELAEKLYKAVHPLSPSIIKYTEPSIYDTHRDILVNQKIDEFHENVIKNPWDQIPVKLISCTKNPDTALCAAILYSYNTGDVESCMISASKFTKKMKKELIMSTLENRECWDRVERAFEMVEYVYELVVSASNYAQLKRHRMSTQLVQDYDISLKYTVPPSVIETGMTAIFTEVMKRSEYLYDSLKKVYPSSKNYALTNAHRRRVLMKLNARELYHFVSLRDDEHAQWDIRDTAQMMKSLSEKAAPLTSVMLSGKSDFISCRERVFGIK